MISQWLIGAGFTRDSALWIWSRLVSGSLIILSIVTTGSSVLEPYISPAFMKGITIGAVIVLWLAGKFDSSPLPGKVNP